MKQRKKHLDEMQDQKLLHIEEIGFWLVFWVLFGAIIVQFLLGAHLKEIAGEIATLFVASIYIAARSLKNGLWTRSYSPNFKTNALASMIPAFLLGVIKAARIFVASPEQFSFDALPRFLPAILFVYVMCLIVLEVMRVVYVHRRKKLDDFDDEIGGKQV